MFGIFNAISSFFDTIVFVIEYFISIITSFIQFIIDLVLYLGFLVLSFTGIPSFIMPFLTISLTVSVLFLVLGRGRSN